MNEVLQKKLSTLESLIATQKDCVIAGYPETSYLHGMLNGLICAHSLFSDSEPKFYSKPRKRRPKNVRHKIINRKKAKK